MGFSRLFHPLFTTLTRNIVDRASASCYNTNRVRKIFSERKHGRFGYKLKTAVGTSVFIMTFTPFTGATSHFIIGGGISNVWIFGLCVIFPLISAFATAKFSNKDSPKTINRLLGVRLTVMSAVLIIINLP